MLPIVQPNIPSDYNRTPALTNAPAINPTNYELNLITTGRDRSIRGKAHHLAIASDPKPTPHANGDLWELGEARLK